MKYKLTLLILAAGPLLVNGQMLTTFDPAGSTNTFPTAINLSGAIAGYFIDSTGFHGFLRNPASGAFTTFNPPADSSTSGTVVLWAMNGPGTVVGTYRNGSVQTGFMRDALGTFADVAPPGATLVNVLIGVNDSGVIAGSYTDSGLPRRNHGFVRDVTGSYTVFDVAGATAVNVASINNNGEIAGYWADTASKNHGFFRDKKGTVSTFDAPVATTSFQINGMNDSGEIIGFYSSDGGVTMHGFVRTVKGSKFASFDADSAKAMTLPYGINSFGTIVGFVCAAGFNSCSGFVRNAPVHGAITGTGSFVAVDFPGALATELTAVNDQGAMTGPWIDNGGAFERHGFLRQ